MTCLPAWPTFKAGCGGLGDQTGIGEHGAHRGAHRIRARCTSCTSCIKKRGPGHAYVFRFARWQKLTYQQIRFFFSFKHERTQCGAAVLCDRAPNRKPGNEATNFSAQRLASCSENGGSKNRPDLSYTRTKMKNAKPHFICNKLCLALITNCIVCDRFFSHR